MNIPIIIILCRYTYYYTIILNICFNIVILHNIHNFRPRRLIVDGNTENPTGDCKQKVSDEYILLY